MISINLIHDQNRVVSSQETTSFRFPIHLCRFERRANAKSPKSFSVHRYNVICILCKQNDIRAGLSATHPERLEVARPEAIILWSFAYGISWRDQGGIAATDTDGETGEWIGMRRDELC